MSLSPHDKLLHAAMDYLEAYFADELQLSIRDVKDKHASSKPDGLLVLSKPWLWVVRVDAKRSVSDLHHEFKKADFDADELLIVTDNSDVAARCHELQMSHVYTDPNCMWWMERRDPLDYETVSTHAKSQFVATLVRELRKRPGHKQQERIERMGKEEKRLLDELKDGGLSTTCLNNALGTTTKELKALAKRAGVRFDHGTGQWKLKEEANG